MIINRETFEESGDAHEGTVEVTLRGETRRVRALKFDSSETIIAYGMTGRYQTGTKAWPATVSSRPGHDGKFFEFVGFGRDDRSGKFRKENCLSFAD